MKKVFYALIIFATFSTLYAEKLQTKIDKSAYLEIMYGFGVMNFPQNGYIHEAQLRAFFPTSGIMHEILARGTLSQNTKSHKIPSKYQGYEAEYRVGMRMDGQFDNMGMIIGSAYIGLGYQNLIQKFQHERRNSHFLYLPIGFWGEDTMGEGGGFMAIFKLRYGINTKMIFVDNYNNDEKLKGHFLFGGKIYLGVGVKVVDILDIFAQAYFQYGVPIRNTRIYGIEAGLQF